MSRFLRGDLIVAGLLASVVALVSVVVLSNRVGQYPYGRSHCCIKQFALALQLYAQAHEGRLPTGGTSPEASLSLLIGDKYGMDPEIMRGKTVPLRVVQQALQNNGFLGPKSCGWHYVEGLTLADDPRLAVIWDKVGLGHNGQLLPGGGHEVAFLDGRIEIVSASEWPKFLRLQKQLIAARTAAAIAGLPMLTAKVKLPSGEIVERYEAKYELSGSSWESSSGPLRPECLRWYHLRDGVYEYSLTLGRWTSPPVAVNVSQGRATPAAFIFELK